MLDVVADEVRDLGHHVRHRRGEDDAGAEAREDRQPELRPRRVRVPREHCSREFWWNFTQKCISYSCVKIVKKNLGDFQESFNERKHA